MVAPPIQSYSSANGSNGSRFFVFTTYLPVDILTVSDNHLLLSPRHRLQINHVAEQSCRKLSTCRMASLQRLRYMRNSMRPEYRVDVASNYLFLAGTAEQSP
ncbi:Hypothetical protein R9X50_00601100 [Acrodontium crateriforme]|uniref:Uncharacterized protein n=1 Tax=Acrodontium crateriforme TaxID=150365 RepID=A0AAQ3RBC8_9PEZI|nr:Hypothetical protein R9X50_00601100 [Acrodontium crateriforme]